MVGHRFHVHASNPYHAILKSAGTDSPWTTLTPDGENVPIEIAGAKSHEGLYMHLRYETFVHFDTGDLNRFADELAASLTSQRAAT